MKNIEKEISKMRKLVTSKTMVSDLTDYYLYDNRSIDSLIEALEEYRGCVLCSDTNYWEEGHSTTWMIVLRTEETDEDFEKRKASRAAELYHEYRAGLTAAKERRERSKNEELALYKKLREKYGDKT